jgi:hypothetical protein
VAATLVFAQAEGALIPFAALAGQARAHFSASVNVLDAGVAEPASGGRLEVVASGERGIFRLGARAITPGDVALARDAERRGHAAGMGDLAARCRSVWSVEAESGAPEWLLLELCALLAFAALGPVLPPDGSTLLGVRSARERAARLRAVG